MTASARMPSPPYIPRRAGCTPARGCTAQAPAWCQDEGGDSMPVPAIQGRTRHRLHGGLGPGAPRGRDNGNYRRGDWTIEAQEAPGWRGPRAKESGSAGRPIAPKLENRIRAALDKPGRIGAQDCRSVGVDPGTVQRGSCPFEDASVGG
jgi:hypothetical protein